jgi:alkylation response protein AidB-like acyl-CoA dehydrogenase
MTDPTVDREARHAQLAQRFLPDALLETLRERAALHDAENSFAHDDLADLQERGYLALFVPEEMGGAGLNLHEVTRLQQRLSGAAPGTALAINMHLMTTGVVHAMRARGDHSLDWVLEEAAAGEVFAFGISEPANDWVLQGSNTLAVPQEDGGYRLSGVKIFTSLSPVWSRLIVHGLDESDPEDPRLVYGFVERTADGITVSDDWDVVGMRASHSRATILKDVKMEPHRVARAIDPGPVPDLLTFAITSNFQLLVAAVYAGVARRALEAGAQALHQRRSAKKGVGAGVAGAAGGRPPGPRAGAGAPRRVRTRLRRGRGPRRRLAAAARGRADPRRPCCTRVRRGRPPVVGRPRLQQRPRALPPAARCDRRPVPPAQRGRGPSDVRGGPAGHLTPPPDT